MKNEVKCQVIENIKREKLIAIVRGVSSDDLIPLAEALYRGGIRLLEVTYAADGRVSDEEISESIGVLARHFEGRMDIGAGTVLTEAQVELTASVGGKFIISPDTNGAVIGKTVECGLVSIPGALTPTEIQRAHLFGADFVKLFPVTSLGADYVRAVRAPLSHIELLAVGGVDTENMGEYLSAGVSGFGLGSNIVNKKMLAARDYDGIAALAAKYKEVVEKWQSI